MEIPSKIQEEILYYCKINNIEDVDKFLLKILRNGFNIVKYGNGPTSIVIAPKDEVEFKHVTLDVNHEIKPISLDVSKPLQDVIDLQSKVGELKKEILESVKIPETKLTDKKRNLYDE